MNLFRLEGQSDRAKTAYTPFPRSGGIVKSWYINKQQIVYGGIFVHYLSDDYVELSDRLC